MHSICVGILVYVIHIHTSMLFTKGNTRHACIAYVWVYVHISYIHTYAQVILMFTHNKIHTCHQAHDSRQSPAIRGKRPPSSGANFARFEQPAISRCRNSPHCVANGEAYSAEAAGQARAKRAVLLGFAGLWVCARALICMCFADESTRYLNFGMNMNIWYKHICIYIHTHVCVCVCLHTYKYAYVHVCMYLYMCVCMYMYMYIYIYIHTYAYIYTNTYTDITYIHIRWHYTHQVAGYLGLATDQVVEEWAVERLARGEELVGYVYCYIYV
jgi:hypothetical protein